MFPARSVPAGLQIPAGSTQPKPQISEIIDPFSLFPFSADPKPGANMLFPIPHTRHRPSRPQPRIPSKTRYRDFSLRAGRPRRGLPGPPATCHLKPAHSAQIPNRKPPDRTPGLSKREGRCPQIGARGGMPREDAPAGTTPSRSAAAALRRGPPRPPSPAPTGLPAPSSRAGSSAPGPAAFPNCPVPFLIS